MKTTTNTCIFCGKSPKFDAIFYPFDSVYALRYALCGDCATDPDAAERAEKILEHEMTTRATDALSALVRLNRTRSAAHNTAN